MTLIQQSLSNLIGYKFGEGYIIAHTVEPAEVNNIPLYDVKFIVNSTWSEDNITYHLILDRDIKFNEMILKDVLSTGSILFLYNHVYQGMCHFERY